MGVPVDPHLQVLGSFPGRNTAQRSAGHVAPAANMVWMGSQPFERVPVDPHLHILGSFPSGNTAQKTAGHVAPAANMVWMGLRPNSPQAHCPCRAHGVLPVLRRLIVPFGLMVSSGTEANLPCKGRGPAHVEASAGISPLSIVLYHAMGFCPFRELCAAVSLKYPYLKQGRRV